MTPSASYEMASVLFMDIVGYSLRTIEEQTELLTTLQSCVRESAEYKQASAKEELISLATGDGVALVFLRDPVSPVTCALEVAAALKSHPGIRMRMGIHQGPVRRHADIKNEINVVGGGINMAQRVMDSGDAGHILVSRNVAEVLEQLRGWADCLQDLGIHEVKHGVKVQLYNLRKDDFGNPETPKKLMAGRQASAPPSLAVLPFANMSADKENEYFSDGLAEEILNLMSKVPGLRVIARTSSFAFRGREDNVTKIAEALRVENILEGSVRRSGNRSRITVQLVQASDGSQLWSERYDREMTDIFAVQDEIGQAVATALKVRFTTHTRVVNVEAWEHCLKGIHYRGRNVPGNLLKALEHFKQALAIDPNYVQAYAGLALCYYVLGAVGVKPVAEAKLLAREAAGKALAIDPSNSESHAVLGVMAGVFDYDWELGAKHHALSVAVEQPPPTARYCYALYCLLPKNRFDEAIEQVRRALRSDPLSVLCHAGLAWCLSFAGRHQEAIESGQRAIDIDPNHHISWQGAGLVQLCGGLPREAVASFARVWYLAPGFHLAQGGLAAAHALAGDAELAKQMAQQFVRPDGRDIGHAIYFAVAGDAEGMFEALNSAFEQRDIFLTAVRQMAFFDRYRSDPRYRDLLARMNLE